MNTAAIYKEATSPKLEVSQEHLNKKAVEASRVAALKLDEQIQKTKWLQDSYTKKVLKELEEKRNEFNQQAINQAKSYPTHNNHQQIIQLLQQVAEIDNIIDTYARPSNS